MFENWLTLIDHNFAIVDDHGECFAYAEKTEKNWIEVTQSSIVSGFPRIDFGDRKIIIGPGIANMARLVGLVTSATVFTLIKDVDFSKKETVITLKDLLKEEDWPSPKGKMSKVLEIFRLRGIR